jgi:hypothetical protein
MGDARRGGRPFERLQGLRPPDPPRGLRGRTIAAATAALAAEAEVDLWTRLWSSRGLRLAWAAAVSGLMVAHIAVTVRHRPAAGVDRMPAAVSASRLAGELAEIADLPRIDPIVLASVP